MAESDVHIDRIEGEEQVMDQQSQKLEYLEFIQLAALQALFLASRIYSFAKEKSGPLKPGVQTVEGTFKSVVGPVYDKFHGVPFQVLKFVDVKMGESVGEIGRPVPSPVKDASNQVYNAAQKAPEVVRSISGEVRRAGVIGTATGIARAAYTKAEPTAKEIYGKCEPVAEQYAVSAWRSLNRLPVFPQVAHILVPTAAHWSDKYNKAVTCSTDKGYAVSAYLPLVPIERIAKVFGDNGEAVAPAAASVASE